MNSNAQQASMVRHLAAISLLMILAAGLWPGRPALAQAPDPTGRRVVPGIEASGDWGTAAHPALELPAYFTAGEAMVMSQTATAAANWIADGNQEGAAFGHAVATAGDVNGDGYDDVIVGAHWYSNGEDFEGGAFVFHGSASGLSAAPDWTAEGNWKSAEFGYAVGAAGDVNGDGYDDVIVGAHTYSTNPDDEINPPDAKGRAYVYYGSATGLSAEAGWMIEGDQDYAEFGNAVGTAGDVNGDGYDDIIVGAYRYTNGQNQNFEGRAYVFHGSEDGLSMIAAWTAEGNQINAGFGWSVGTAGDVDGDGYADVIVGAYQHTNGQNSEGRAYVFHGSEDGLSTTADWTAESNVASAKFGYAVGAAGDVNGDGYADVIVGAPGYYITSTQAGEGRAYVYYGSSSGLGATPWTAESNQSGAGLGISAGTAGDVNADGYADIIVGADLYDSGETDEGRVFIWHGSPSGLGANGTPLNASWSAESDQAGARFGRSAGTAGDVNGNGAADVITGAYLYDSGEADEGRAFVYHEPATPAVTAGLSGDDVVLTWAADPANVQYEVWVSTNPYLDPANPGSVTPIYTAETSYPDAGAAAGLENHFYVVRGLNARGAPSANSNRTGEFTFGLTRGD